MCHLDLDELSVDIAVKIENIRLEQFFLHSVGSYAIVPYTLHEDFERVNPIFHDSFLEGDIGGRKTDRPSERISVDDDARNMLFIHGKFGLLL